MSVTEEPDSIFTEIVSSGLFLAEELTSVLFIFLKKRVTTTTKTIKTTNIILATVAKLLFFLFFLPLFLGLLEVLFTVFFTVGFAVPLVLSAVLLVVVFLGGLLFKSSLETSIKVKPFGTNVFPAFVLSFDSIISFISSGFILPLPTATNVPAIILTIL